jgi:Metal binding domain of Ada
MPSLAFSSATLLAFTIACILTIAQAARSETETEDNANIKAVENFPTSGKDQSEQASTGAARTDEKPDSVTGSERPVDGSDSPPPFKYVGNTFSSKFHRPSCPFAKCMSSYHLVFFEHRHDATDRGFTPCKYCLPPDWKTVHAVILPAQKTSANLMVSHQ